APLKNLNDIRVIEVHGGFGLVPKHDAKLVTRGIRRVDFFDDEQLVQALGEGSPAEIHLGHAPAAACAQKMTTPELLQRPCKDIARGRGLDKSWLERLDAQIVDHDLGFPAVEGEMVMALTGKGRGVGHVEEGLSVDGPVDFAALSLD